MLNFKLETRPLIETESGQLLQMIIFAKNGGEKELKDEEHFKDDFLAQVAVKRIEVMKIVNVSNLFFNISLITFMNRVAVTVMLLWLANNYAKKINKNYLTIDDWCQMFPLGVPTDDSLHKFWKSQKMSDGKNYIDTGDAWT